MLKASLDAVFTQIRELKSEKVLSLASLQRDVVVLKDRVLALETYLGNSSAQGSNCIPQLLLELSDREKCSSNIIVHGL